MGCMDLWMFGTMDLYDVGTYLPPASSQWILSHITYRSWLAFPILTGAVLSHGPNSDPIPNPS